MKLFDKFLGKIIDRTVDEVLLRIKQERCSQIGFEQPTHDLKPLYEGRMNRLPAEHDDSHF
jgi:hypothetical protein